MRRDVFQALADPTRRALILLIAAQAMTPNAMAEQFSISRQAVSKHLRVLAECDMVQPETAGREIYYHLKAEKMNEIQKWLELFQTMLAKRFGQLDDILSTIKKQNHEQ